MPISQEFDYKNMLESAFSAASIGMAFIHPDSGRWLKVNRAVCEFLGYAEEELLALDFQTITHPDDLKADMMLLNMTLRGDINNYRLEKRYFHKDGSTLWGILSVVLIRDEENKPKIFISQIQDITELKRTQLSLGHTSKMIALGEMAADIAHEINNPLAIMALNLTAVTQMLDETPLNVPLLKSFTAKTTDTVKRITNIMTSLLKISRDSSINFELSPLDDILQDALNLSADTLKKKSIALELDVQSGIKLECRPIEISQVLVNLLNNSIYALENRPKKLIRLEVKAEKESVIITLTDTGPGIPKAIREKIMDPFFTTKPQGEGSGLGLSISQNIIAEHMGTLSIKESRAGAKFVIELPLEQLFSGTIGEKKGP